jgi:hypothetical protein
MALMHHTVILSQRYHFSLLSAARRQKESISTIPEDRSRDSNKRIYGNKNTTKIPDNPKIGRRNRDRGKSYSPRVRKYVPG